MSSNRRRNRRQTVSHTDDTYGRAQPAFYRPAPRWHFLVALGIALALEAGAVAFASLQPRPEIPTELGGIAEPPPADVILTELPPEPTPPPRVTTQAAVSRPGPVSYITARSDMLAAPPELLLRSAPRAADGEREVPSPLRPQWLCD